MVKLNLCELFGVKEKEEFFFQNFFGEMSRIHYRINNNNLEFLSKYGWGWKSSNLSLNTFTVKNIIIIKYWEEKVEIYPSDKDYEKYLKALNK